MSGAIAYVRAARLFDGHQLVELPIVSMRDGRFVAVGVAPPADAVAAEFPGATLVPGLIDCHQHLCFDGNGPLEDQIAGVPDDELLERAHANARLALLGGVTTVRDLGDRGYLTLALRGDPTLPTLLCAGPPITCTDGHCWYLGGQCTGGDELTSAVAERADHGCDVIKVMVSGGHGTPTFPMWANQFTPDELNAIVEAAHRHSVPVAAHCHGIDAIGQSIDAGVDTIEHCTFFAASGRSEPTEQLIARLAASGIVVSATVGRTSDEALPPIILANRETVRQAHTRLHELGTTIVAGTDAGIARIKPHDVLRHSLTDLVAQGMTPIAGLRALTSVAAAALGLGSSKGSIRPGFDADLVAVAGDPTNEPVDLISIVAVWRAGHRIR